MSKAITDLNTQLINLGLSEKEADKIATGFYNQMVKEYTTHVRKHLNAAIQANPTKTSEADFISNILDNVENDDKLLTLEIAEKI